MALAHISRYRKEIDNIISDAAENLRDLSKCRTLHEQLKYCSFNLHISYITAELCRPALASSAPDTEESKALKKDGIHNLASTVRAFLELSKVTAYAARSWAAVHRALSSALLLGILEDSRKRPEIKALLSQMIAVIADLARSESQGESELDNPVGPSRAGPLARSLAALRKLNAEKTSTHHHSQSSFPAISSAPDWNEIGNSNATANTNGRTPSDTTGMYTPSPLMGLDQYSPYSLMDSIIWGEGQVPSNIPL